MRLKKEVKRSEFNPTLGQQYTSFEDQIFLKRYNFIFENLYIYIYIKFTFELLYLTSHVSRFFYFLPFLYINISLDDINVVAVSTWLMLSALERVYVETLTENTIEASWGKFGTIISCNSNFWKHAWWEIAVIWTSNKYNWLNLKLNKWNIDDALYCIDIH